MFSLTSLYICLPSFYKCRWFQNSSLPKSEHILYLTVIAISVNVKYFPFFIYYFLYFLVSFYSQIDLEIIDDCFWGFDLFGK